MQGGTPCASSSSACSQRAIGGRLVPTVALSPGRRTQLQTKKRWSVACRRRSRQSHMTIRFLAVSGMGGYELRGSETRANGSIAKGLEAGGETNLGRQEQQREQQLLASTAPADWTPPTYSGFTDSHLLFLGFIACAMTGVLSGVLLSAIPVLLSMKKAADSVRRLADSARDDLPGTMAAVRLSGMEISDLTMELSDLGQEISAGVRSSSRAVRVAEDGLRRLGTFTSVAVVQGKRANGQVEVTQPAVAHAARSTREALIQARNLVHSLMALTRLSSWFGRCWTFIRPLRRKSLPSRTR